jgi:DNA polymerase-3 subunit gamma/tau
VEFSQPSVRAATEHIAVGDQKLVPSPSTPSSGAAAAKPYTVVARRYRPQQFAELIGQEHVAQALVQALQSGRVAHAYLFTGARGVGKTSTARILAKALNCVQGPTPYPCDHCDICRAITSGDDVDVLEIDGASNRGIEDARDLRHSVGFRPVRARFKIYIIDEVHMLTREAFNALLKTLEEPPPHVKFIFATTEVQKIPITILSRCQRFDFAFVRPAHIAEHLQRIVQREGREAQPEALHLIARKANGSMRDAQSLLDQLLAAESGRLTLERVRQLLGLSSEEQVQQLAEAVFRRDPASALQLLTQWYDQGVQPAELIDQLISYWRNLMLIRCGGADIREMPVDPILGETLRRQAEQVSLDTILAGLDVWTAARGRLRDAFHAQVLLEMAVVRLARMEELLSVGALWNYLTQGGATPTAVSAQATSRGSRGVAGVGTAAASTPPASGQASPTAAGDSLESTAAAGIPLTAHTLEGVWSECLRRIKEKFPLQSSHLNTALPPVLSGSNTLVIRFATQYNWAYEALVHAAEFTRRLEETLQAIVGQAVAVRYELTTDGGDRTEKKSKAVAGPESQSPTSTAKSSSQGMGGLARDPRRQWMEWPLFRRAIETLDAQIIRVDEGFEPRASLPNTEQPAEINDDDLMPPSEESTSE